MADNSITSNLSTAPISVPLPQVTVTSSSAFGPRNNPQDVVKNNATAGGSLIYPSDRPKYYMQFDIMNYSRESLNSIGTLSPVSSGAYPDGGTVVLPIAQTMRDVHQVYWDDKFPVGTTAGALVDAGASALRNQGDIKSALTGAIKDIPEVGKAIGLAEAEKLVSGAAGGAEAILGLAPNKFMTVLFIGPLYKRHNFVWLISPRSPGEAETIRKIDKTFHNAMSPNLGAAGLIWTFPKIFKIAIYPNTKYMYKFKPCVLESFEVNYTPGGRFAVYADNGLGDNPPEGVIISMRFLELEYWLEGNYNDSADPFDTYTTSGASSSNAAEQLNTLVDQFLEWFKAQPGNLRDNIDKFGNAIVNPLPNNGAE